MSSIRVQPIGREGLTIRLRRSAESWSPADDAAWDGMIRANPRLHDGPIAFATEWSDTEIRGEISGYRRLMLRGARQDPALAMGVTGVLTRRGGSEVLMGRRSDGVRIYGGLWETAPRGGLDISRPNDQREIRLGLIDLASRVSAEAREELGIELDPRSLRAVATVIDEQAGSLDVVMAGEISAELTSPASWEYTAVGWSPRRNLGLIGPLSPPTAALAAWLASSSSC